jgi:hypothetical protein
VRYYYDTEFLEDGRTIELISIGIVAEDGREYYAVNRGAPWKRIADHQWLVENVARYLPRLHGDARICGQRSNRLALDFADPAFRSRRVIAEEVRGFLLADGKPELWAWYCAYDHVVLAQLFGRMLDLPDGIPMWTNDLRSLAYLNGDPDLSVVPHPGQEHNALADAQWTRAAHLWLARQLREGTP